MSIGSKLSDIATEGVVKCFEAKFAIEDLINKPKYNRSKMKKKSLTHDREIDKETGYGILEVTTNDGVVTAFESKAPVIRVTGSTAKSIMISIDNKKGKNKLGKIVSIGGIGLALLTPGTAALAGVAVSAGGVFLSANNQIKNSNKYNVTIESEDCVIFRLKDIKKED